MAEKQSSAMGKEEIKKEIKRRCFMDPLMFTNEESELFKEC